eukprot:2046854-Pleurochrysis_carterae.AAC.5
MLLRKISRRSGLVSCAAPLQLRPRVHPGHPILQFVNPAQTASSCDRLTCPPLRELRLASAITSTKTHTTLCAPLRSHVAHRPTRLQC